MATWTGATWAISEQGLEVNVAPESATTPPAPYSLQRLIDFPLFHPRVTLNLRTYDFGQDFEHVPTQQTWAAGGRLGLETPEWRETVSAGVAVYGSFPLYQKPGNVDITRLVKPDGDALRVPGETYLNLRHDGLNLRLYRQLLDADYLNAQDNRMIPNVHEAYTLIYKSDRLYGGVGEVTRMKTRASDEYLPMAEVAGVRGGTSGASVAGARLQPTDRTSISGIMIYNWDVFSILYTSARVGTDLGPQTDLNLSGQFTSQRSVGEQQLGHFDTYNAGLKLDLGYRKAVFTLAGTTTGSDAGIISPFGQKPSYLSLMLFDGFDRAHERAWLVGLSYRLDDFALPSWSFVLNHAEGEGARNPRTGADLPRARETDLTVDYRPTSGQLAGLWLRMRYADGSLGDQSLKQWRIILNYEIKFKL